MSVDVIDLVDLAHQEKRRKNIFNTPRFHCGCIIINRDRKMRCIVTMPIKPFT